MKKLILAALLTLPAPAIRAQSANPAPPSASQAILEVVVTNKKGTVRDLAPGDFKLSLDGKDQAVENAVQLGSAGWPQRPNKHFLVLLVDSGAIANSDRNLLRQRLAKFFEVAARPDRYIAVITWYNGVRIVQPFTTDSSLLKASLDTVIQSIGLASPSTPATAPTTTASPRGGMTPASAGEDQIVDTRRLLEGMPGIAQALGGIRGRKAILFYTGGRVYNRDTSIYVDGAVTALNKANVGVYGVTDDPSFANTLASPTGGDVIQLTRAEPEALAKIADEQDSYYSLVFAPSAGLGSGCRKVQLKLTPSGVDARFRKQICFESSDDPLAGQPAGKELEERATGTSRGAMSVAMNVPFFYNGPNRARVYLAAEIATAGIAFRKEKSQFVAELDVVGVSTKEDGSAGPHFSDVVKFAFETQQQVDAFMKLPYHYEKQVEFPAGRYTVRVAFGSGAVFGRAQAALAIDPWTPTQFAVSGMAFGKPRRAASSGLTAAVPPALLEGIVPLTFKGVQLAPTGTSSFSAADVFVVYAEVQAPGGDPKKAASVTLNARVVDVKSGESKFDSGPVNSDRYALPDSAVIPVVFDLPVKQLGPGSYRLELSAQAGESKTSRTVDYEVK